MVAYLDSHEVSAEYSYWRFDEMEVRSYLIATNKAMGQWFEARGELAETTANEVFDPDYHDVDLAATLFHDDVGVWPNDYFWQLSSAVIKDACTLYEVFLENMAHAVLSRRGAGLSKRATEDSWTWPQCRLFYSHYLEIDVRPPPTEAIFWIRNKLTHLRGDLRTNAGQAEFADHVQSLNLGGEVTPEEAALGLVGHDPFRSRGVRLSQLETLRLLNLLAEQVATVAKAAFPFDYGSETTPYLSAVLTKSLIPLKDFPAKLIAL